MIIDKDNIKILLIILVVGLGLGYAYINSDLNINGTAQVNHANWDVHWANVAVTTGSVSASSPTISNQTTVNYSIVLNTPGDYYEFTVDAVNGGSIDAMIDTISSKLNGATITTLPAYLKYTVTYEDGIELEPKHELLHNTSEKYKVRIEYNTDIELNQLPATNQTLSLQFTVTYRQATSSAMPVRNYVYRSSMTESNHGSNVSTIGTIYETYQEVVSATGHNTFLRHRIENNQVVETAVGFVYNNNVYYLIGEGATYNPEAIRYNPDSIYYEPNKEVLNSAFGSNNCSENNAGNDYYTYKCSVSNYDIDTYSAGYAYAKNNGWICFVFEDGYSRCDTA